MNENRPDIHSDFPPSETKAEENVEKAGEHAAGESGVAPDRQGETSDPQGEVIVAKLVEEDAGAIRSGSPFAVDPQPVQPPRPIEPLLDVGPLKYTAMGATAAAALVLAFALAAAWWFPGGGALIAALGCVLSIFGIYSHFRVMAGALLTMHLLLFVYCYGQTL